MTAYHRINHLLKIKARKEDILGRLSAARVVDDFNKQAKLATDSEPLTVDMMNGIFAIHHTPSRSRRLSLIEHCERRFLLQSPSISFAKLHLIVRSAKGNIILNMKSCARCSCVFACVKCHPYLFQTGPYAIWVLQQMRGRLESSSIKPEDLIARALGANGLVALYCMKRNRMQQ